MKIISGNLKGRTIDMPKGIRPTSDKVREALFEILKQRIEGASFLDLYCGSGAIGIEALSRGAKAVSFVDTNISSIKILRKNLARVGISGLSSIYIYKNNSIKAIREFYKDKKKFDIVFLDPPYYHEIAKNTLIELSNYDILTRNAVIVAEVFKKEDLPDEIRSITKFKTSLYGDTKLEFFKP
ncbi:MAG: 16S rRNA (guanine(966)-N(2))-methyltransferase RsmD [Candidatus Omnitrophota bacterium]